MNADNSLSEELHARVYALQTPGVTRSLEELRLLYPDRVSIKKLQSELDQALGERSLVGELFQMRGRDG